jgi:uncharacterized protein
VCMALMVACPTCKKKIAYQIDNPYRPFCSQRCRLIDLGTWLEEGHRIPAEDAAVMPDNGGIVIHDGQDD